MPCGLISQMRCVPKIEFPELRIRHRDYTTVKTVSTVKLLVANSQYGVTGADAPTVG